MSDVWSFCRSMPACTVTHSSRAATLGADRDMLMTATWLRCPNGTMYDGSSSTASCSWSSSRPTTVPRKVSGHSARSRTRPT